MSLCSLLTDVNSTYLQLVDERLKELEWERGNIVKTFCHPDEKLWITVIGAIRKIDPSNQKLMALQVSITKKPLHPE